MGRLNIAVGIIYSADDVNVLIGQRPEGLDQAGFWEFPGGKIETGEDSVAALKRELLEEVNIEVISCSPLLEYDYDYHHKQVRLYVHEVKQWQGELTAKENQMLKWVEPQELPLINMLAGNKKIIYALLNITSE